MGIWAKTRRGESVGNYSDALKNLHELLADPEEDVTGIPLAKIKEDLKKEGIDSDQMVADVKLMIAGKLADRGG